MNNYNFDLEKYIEELETMVNQDSGSEYPEGVGVIASFLKEKYDNLGWITKLHHLDESVGPCLEIKNKDTDEFDVLLIGHMDTVFPQGTAVERPFKIEGNRAYGPGVVDMKASLLSIYYAMEQLSAGTDEMPSICILHNSDEEISSRSSRPLIEELAKKSKFALILEPARKNGALVNGRKGLAKFAIEFNGVAAHSGVNPQDGISAINELGNWIVELHKLTDYEIETTVNVGIVSGGTKANVVAANAKAEVDLRFKIPTELERVENKFKELLENPFTKGIEVNVKRIGYRPPMNPTKEAEVLYNKVNELGENLGIDIQWVFTGGGSDANFTAALGVPTIDGMGPVGGDSHGINEYLEIDTVEPRLNLLKELIKAIPSL